MARGNVGGPAFVRAVYSRETPRLASATPIRWEVSSGYRRPSLALGGAALGGRSSQVMHPPSTPRTWSCVSACHFGGRLSDCRLTAGKDASQSFDRSGGAAFWVMIAAGQIQGGRNA